MLSRKEIQQILTLKKNYSIYAIFADRQLFQRIVDEMAKPFENKGITKVVGLEARGFILGGAIAYKLTVGFTVCRKGGMMFNTYSSIDDVYNETFIDYSGKSKSLEIEKHEMSIQPGDKVLLVDDWFETGESGQAAIRLINTAGGSVVGISVLLDQMANNIKNSFEPFNLHTLIEFLG